MTRQVGADMPVRIASCAASPSISLATKFGYGGMLASPVASECFCTASVFRVQGVTHCVVTGRKPRELGYGMLNPHVQPLRTR
jgi:hypothetical protein